MTSHWCGSRADCLIINSMKYLDDGSATLLQWAWVRIQTHLCWYQIVNLCVVRFMRLGGLWDRLWSSLLFILLKFQKRVARLTHGMPQNWHNFLRLLSMSLPGRISCFLGTDSHFLARMDYSRSLVLPDQTSTSCYVTKISQKIITFSQR